MREGRLSSLPSWSISAPDAPNLLVAPAGRLHAQGQATPVVLGSPLNVSPRETPCRVSMPTR